MADLKLYEYAVILQAKKDKDGDVVEPGEVLIPPTPVLADDDKKATLLAGRAIPEDRIDDLDRITLVVRPF